MTIKPGRIITNTRPGGLNIYLDGEPVLDLYGNIAKTPTVIANVSTGIHNITFSKPGYDTTTVMVDVKEDSDCYARAILATKSIRYPMMLGNKKAEFGQAIPYTVSSTSPILGDLFIDSNPQGGNVYVDGNTLIDINGRAALTPVRVTTVREGLHEVQISLDRYYTEKVFINVIPDKVNDISVTLQPIYG